MKSYELEALIKSFFIFFILQMAFLSHLMWHQYKTAVQNFENSLVSEMKICSLDLQCQNYSIDFIKKIPFKKDKLYQDENSLYMLFFVPTVNDFLLKIALDKKQYNQKLKELQLQTLKHNIWYIIFIIVSSLLFALYSLYPLKKALQINEEFIKDILHDINTPISALIINLKLLQKEFGENKRIQRAKYSIDTIVALQENLKAFLGKNKMEKELIVLKELLESRIQYFQSLYPHIKFSLTIEKNSTILTNKEAFIRILDNIIENACKYAQAKDAYVNIILKDKSIIIEDNGVGIKDVKRLFKRYYKEQSRGLGLGMHIVQKLAKALGIEIAIKSKVGQGTQVKLHFKELILS